MRNRGSGSTGQAFRDKNKQARKAIYKQQAQKSSKRGQSQKDQDRRRFD